MPGTILLRWLVAKARPLKRRAPCLSRTIGPFKFQCMASAGEDPRINHTEAQFPSPFAIITAHSRLRRSQEILASRPSSMLIAHSACRFSCRCNELFLAHHAPRRFPFLGRANPVRCPGFLPFTGAIVHDSAGRVGYSLLVRVTVVVVNARRR